MRSAHATTETWRQGYNEVWPHMARAVDEHVRHFVFQKNRR